MTVYATSGREFCHIFRAERKRYIARKLPGWKSGSKGAK